MQLSTFLDIVNAKKDYTMDKPLVTWLLTPPTIPEYADIKPIDNDVFLKQVLRRFRKLDIDPQYKNMITKQQVDDVISCAASIYFRGDYSRDFQYIDMDKGQSYNAFNSGVMCFFPPGEEFDLYKKDYSKEDND